MYGKNVVGLAARTARHLREHGTYRTALSGLNLTANALREYAFGNRDHAARRTAAHAAYWVVSVLFWTLQGYLLIPHSTYVRMYDLYHRRSVCVPNVWQLHHGSRENRVRQAAAYTTNFEIEPGDVVVDVGAYVGQFSLHAAETASKVVAIDPFAAVDECLRRNVGGSATISVHPVAAWNREETLSVQLSHYPSDTSILQPDLLPTGTEVRVPGRPVESIREEAGIDSVDVLKIEAEGVEPEVLEGAPDADRIVVNCGPERRGESPTETVTQILRNRGYDVQTVLTDESLGPKYGESPGLSDIEMVYAER